MCSIVKVTLDLRLKSEVKGRWRLREAENKDCSTCNWARKNEEDEAFRDERKSFEVGASFGPPGDVGRTAPS